MSGIDSQRHTSAPDGPDLAEDMRANAEYARRMHHRQIIRRTLIAAASVAIVVVATLVGVPVARQIKTQWYLQANGFVIDWDLDADNWTNGGVTHVRYNNRSWWAQNLDPMVPMFSNLMNVESLNLADCPISEPALQPLGRLVQVRELDLTRLNSFRYGFTPGTVSIGSPDLTLTDACLVPLLGLPRLKTLYLAGNRITDKGLEQIGRMAALEELDLGATDVTDRGLVHLHSLKRLKSLNIPVTLVTAEGLNALQHAIPGLEISQEIDPEIEQKVKNWRMRKP